MKWLPLATLLLFPAVLAVGGDYYPHQAGKSWTYSNGETQRVGAPVTYKGLAVVPVNHQFGKILVRQDLMEYRSDGSVWLRGVNQNGKLLWFAQPYNVYPPGPLKVGQSWQSGPDTVQVSGVKAVKTKAGTFNALVISTSSGVEARSQLSFFVPTVGVVGYQTADGTLIPLMEKK